MPSSKDIKRRIKSINNTRKITKAMEMVAAAKMRKAVAAALAIRPYAHSAWRILTNLSRAFSETDNKLLEVREVKKMLAIVIASNRGLCGSFNAQIMRKIREQVNDPKMLLINRSRKGLKEAELLATESAERSSVSKQSFGGSTSKNLEIDFITIGKKGENMVKKMGKNIIASFPDLIYLPTVERLRPLSKIVIDEYEKKSYDKAVVFYTDFVSVIKQETRIRQILPVSKTDIERQIVEMTQTTEEKELEKTIMEYKVEPDPESVLTHIFPRLLEMQLLHAILESNASKESARMIAMRNATEAANEMANNLTLIYNQIRQMRITQEIAEISAGRTALEN